MQRVAGGREIGEDTPEAFEFTRFRSCRRLLE